MAMLIAALVVILGNVVLTVVNLQTGGLVNQLFYGWLPWDGLPPAWVRLVFLGILHLGSFKLVLFFLRYEADIASRNRRHVAHRALRAADEYLNNRNEWWPPSLLLPAMLIHILALLLSVQGQLAPGLWWIVAMLLIGLWANHRKGLPPALLHVSPEAEAGSGESTDGMGQAEPQECESTGLLADALMEQEWFRNQMLFRLPWPGELGVGVPAPWRSAADHYSATADAFADQSYVQGLRGNAIFTSALESLTHASSAPSQDRGLLFSHQERALSLLQERTTPTGAPTHVVLATPVGSGNSTVALLAALRKCLLDHSTVLVVYPNATSGRVLINQLTDGLADSGWDWALSLGSYWSDHEVPQFFSVRTSSRDGVRKVEWKDAADLVPHVSDHEAVLRSVDILVTDAETLHSRLLPGHVQWQSFFHQLGMIVFENLEAYTGLLGANAAMAFRRLRRVAHEYGASPQILAIAVNSVDLENFVEELFGIEAADFETRQIVSSNGRGRKEREVIIWTPEIDHEAELGQELRRANYLEQARRILGVALRQGLNPILLQKLVPVCGADVKATSQDVMSRVQAELRREVDIAIGECVEMVLSEGELLRLASPAEFDCAVVAGIPDSWVRLLHELEHLGEDRPGKLAHIVALLPDTPLGQFVGRRAASLLAPSVNYVSSVLPLRNPHLLKSQILAALGEFPATMTAVREWFGGDAASEALQALVSDGTVSKYRVPVADEQGAIRLEDAYAPRQQTEPVSLQSVGGLMWSLEAAGRVVDRIPADRIGWQVYQGAVLVRRQQRFEVERVEQDTRKLIAERIIDPLSEPLSTERVFEVDIRLLNADETRVEEQVCAPASPPLHLTKGLYGEVSERVVGYQFYRSYSYDQRGRAQLNPSLDREPFITPMLAVSLNGGSSLPVLHTLAHAIRAVLPTFIGDVAETIEITEMEDCPLFNGESALTVYDTVPGGTGAAEWLQRASHLQRVLERVYELLVACHCRDGCPGCCVIHNCHSAPAAGCELDKRGCIEVVGRSLGKNVEALIQHRYEKIESTEIAIELMRYLVEHVFPQKLGLHIPRTDVASLIVVKPEELPKKYLGTYQAAENVVRVKPQDEERMLTLLAHEYAHNWQWKGKQRMSDWLRDPERVPYFDGRLFVEGFAQWVEFKAAEYYGFRRRMDEVQFRHFGAYSEGFQALHWIERPGAAHRPGISGGGGGASKVVEFIRTGRLTLQGEEVSINELFQRSNLQARLMDAQRRFKADPPRDDIL